MWVWAEVWEECGRRRWDFLHVNFNDFLDDFTTYFGDLCLLSGIGRGAEAQLGPDRLVFAEQQHWPWRGSGLVFGEDGEDSEEPVMRGERYCSRDPDRANPRWNSELSERKTTEHWCWDVPSQSCRSEWFWDCSFNFTWDNKICEYERKYEKNAVEGVEISCMWISTIFRWFHHVFWRSLSAVRHWQRGWSTTRPWQTCICRTTTLALKGLRLGVWWGWWGFWRNRSMRGRGTAVGIQTELIDGGIVNWVKGKAIQRIGAEMCQVHDADLSEFEVRVETETSKGGTVKLVRKTIQNSWWAAPVSVLVFSIWIWGHVSAPEALYCPLAISNH